MKVEAIAYTSADEMRAKAHALRVKLMNLPKPEPIKKPVIRLVQSVVTARDQLPKDAHVDDFRRWQWESARRASNVASFIRVRAIELGSNYDDIIGPDTTRALVAKRHQIIWEVNERFDLSLPAIGRYFGRRDHTSILFAIRKIEKLKASSEG